jgi:hypothetical protein
LNPGQYQDPNDAAARRELAYPLARNFEVSYLIQEDTHTDFSFLRMKGAGIKGSGECEEAMNLTSGDKCLSLGLSGPTICSRQVGQ